MGVIRQSVVLSVAAGSMGVISQRVGWSAQGSMGVLRQYVRLRLTASGSMGVIRQAVQAQASGSMGVIAQRVKQAGVTTQLDLKGWDAFLYIDGIEVPQNQVIGEIIITRAENSAALMTVPLRPPKGVQDLESYRGKAIKLNVETVDGVFRLYTGVIDNPDIDTINGFLNLRCTDRRRELINAQIGPQLGFIGRWSSDIFDGADDAYEELEQRLQTTPKTVDLNAHGQITVSNFLPKSTPDFILSSTDIYRRNPPTIKLANRGRLINRVNLKFEMRYVRLRQRKRNFELIGPDFCDIMTTQGLSFILVDALTNQLKSFAWPVNFSDMQVYNQPTSGIYNCGNGPFIYSTVVRTSGTYQQKTDADGNVITDSNDNPIIELVNGGFVDLGQNFCERATWSAAFNFAQDVSEIINIKIDAPQSIAQYGVIEKAAQHGREVDFDSSSWEKNERYIDQGGTVTDEFYTDKTGSAQAYIDSLQTAFSMHETEIIKSHRANEVEFERFLWPQVDLKHTVRLEDPRVVSQGKVTNIEHILDISNGHAYSRVQTSQSRAVGSPPSDSLSFPLLNAPLVGNQSPATIKTYSYNADDFPTLNELNTSNRVIGLRTPAIDDESRERQTYERNFSIDIPIQNDDLTVTFV